MALTEKTEKRGGAGRGQGRKAIEIKSSAKLNMRCLISDKNIWQASADAQGIGLSEWVIKKLNDAAN